MKPARTQPLPRCNTEVAVPLSILDPILRYETLFELRQAIVDVADVLCCEGDLLTTVVTVTMSEIVTGAVVRTAMSTALFSLFFNPSRETTDPLFVFVPVSVFWMTFLPEPTADLAISPPEPVADGTAMVKFPEGLLQLPVSVNPLFIKSQAGFPQFRKRVTKFMEVNFRFDRTLVSEIFDPGKKD